jgi:hypothetical protein
VRGRQGKNRSIEVVAEDRHDSLVAADNRQDSRVPQRTEGGRSSNSSRRESRSSRYADRGRKEFVVYVTSIGRAEQNNRSRRPVNHVAGRHNTAVPVIRDIVCSIEGTPPAQRSRGSVGNARVSSRRGVCHVFESVAGDAAVGPDYN